MDLTVCFEYGTGNATPGAATVVFVVVSFSEGLAYCMLLLWITKVAKFDFKGCTKATSSALDRTRGSHVASDSK